MSPFVIMLNEPRSGKLRNFATGWAILATVLCALLLGWCASVLHDNATVAATKLPAKTSESNTSLSAVPLSSTK
jgi:hypothetical protein